MPRGLTLKQERFINAYFENGGNGTQAAREAGYTGSDNVLHSTAIEVLQSPTVSLHVRARLAAERVTPDRIVERLAELAFMSFDDERIKIREFDRTGAVKSIRNDYTPMTKSLELLAKAAGMFQQKIEVTHGIVRQLEYVMPPALLQARIERDKQADDADTEPADDETIQ